jgi:TPR repeat protein
LFTALRISLILFIALSCNGSFASDAHATTLSAPAEASKSASANTGEPFVGPSSEAKKLYKRYKKATDKTITAIACVRNPKCIEPEDEVLRYSKEALRILQKLDELSAEGDIQANYYLGLIAYERGVYYDTQAELITHPDFILTATVYRRYAKQQFLLAEKYFALPAKEKNPYACQYLGDVYSSTILGAPRKDKATNYYYTAAIEFISQGNKIDGAKMFNAMKENANPADSRIVEVYAKLHNVEPIASWRKLPSDLVQKPTSKKPQQH